MNNYENSFVLIKLSIAFCTIASDLLSNAEVASSRICPSSPHIRLSTFLFYPKFVGSTARNSFILNPLYKFKTIWSICISSPTLFGFCLRIRYAERTRLAVFKYEDFLFFIRCIFCIFLFH